MDNKFTFRHIRYDKKTRKFQLCNKHNIQTSSVDAFEASKYLLDCIQTLYYQGTEAISNESIECYNITHSSIRTIYCSYRASAFDIAVMLPSDKLYPYLKALLDNLTAIPYHDNTPYNENKRFFVELLNDILTLILSEFIQSNRIELYKIAADFFAFDSISLITKHGYRSAALFFEMFRKRLTRLEGTVKRASFWNSALDKWNYEDTKEEGQFVDRHAFDGPLHKARGCTPTSCAAYFALLAKDMGDSTHDELLSDYAEYSAALHRVTKVYESNYSVQYSKKAESIVIPDDAEEITLNEAKKILLELSKRTEIPAIKVASLEMVAQVSSPIKAEFLALKENLALRKHSHSAGTNVYDKTLGTRGRGILLSLFILIGTGLLAGFLAKSVTPYLVWNFHYSSGFRTDILIISIIAFFVVAVIVGIHSMVTYSPSHYDKVRDAVTSGTMSALFWSGNFRNNGL